MFLLLKQVADSRHMALALKRMDTLGRERSRKDSRISYLWKGQVNVINILGLKRLNGLCLDYRTPPPAPNWPLAIDINSQRVQAVIQWNSVSKNRWSKHRQYKKGRGQQIPWSLVCQLGPCGIALRHNSFLHVIGLGQRNPRSHVKSGRGDHAFA